MASSEDAPSPVSPGAESARETARPALESAPSTLALLSWWTAEFQRLGDTFAGLHGGAVERQLLRFAFVGIEPVEFVERMGEPGAFGRGAGDAGFERDARILGTTQRCPRAGDFDQQSSDFAQASSRMRWREGLSRPSPSCWP